MKVILLNFKRVVKFILAASLLYIGLLLSPLIMGNSAEAAVSYNVSHPNKALWDANCASNTPAYGVYGFTFIAPSSITIQPDGTATATMYNYLCNASSGTVYGNYVNYGDNFVQQTGNRPAIDFSSSGLTQRSGGYYRLTMVNPSSSSDNVSSGRSSLASWPIVFRGSAFGSSGTYTVNIQGYGEIYSTTQGYGLTNTAYTPYTIQVNYAPVATAPDCIPSSQTVNVGQTATFNATGGNNTFSWSASGSPASSATSGTGNSTFNVAYNSPGSYSVTVSSNGTDTCNLTVNSLPGPVCAPSPQTVNVGQTATFNATGGNNTFSWSASGSPASSATSGTGNSTFNVAYNSPGSYSVTATSNGINSSCSLNVNAPASGSAEVFIYSPEVFFNSPFYNPEPYQSITNLPPVL